MLHRVGILLLAIAVSLAQHARGAVLVWTNLNGGNWSVAGNWNPNQVPGWGDTIVITNAGIYSVTNDQNATVGSLFLGSPSAGAQTFLVPTGSSLSLSGGSMVNSNSAGGGGVMMLVGGLTLYNAFTNAGTIRMTNQLTTLINDGSISQSGGLLNLGLLDLQGSARINGPAGGYAYLTNNGQIVRSAGPGTSLITVVRFETSAGTVSAQTGTLNLGNFVGTLAGTFTAATGATNELSGGTDLAHPVVAGSPLVLGGAGQYRFTGGYLHLPMDIIPNLALAGGTTTLGTSFQGGSIVNLAVAGTKLVGTNVVTGSLKASSLSMLAGTFTVSSGAVLTVNNALFVGLNLDSRITVQNGGVLQVGPLSSAVNASGSDSVSQSLEVAAGGLLNLGASLSVHGPFTNAGVINLTNSPLVLVNDGSPAHQAGLVNVAGGALNVWGTGRVTGSSLTPNQEYVINQGQIVKRSSVGTNTLNVASLINQGAITAEHGVLEMNQVTLQPAGSLNVLLSSPTDAGCISVTNPVSLAGTFGVILTNGYVPAAGAWITVLNYSSRSGQFDRTNLPLGLTWETWYDTSAFKIRSAAPPSGTTVAHWVGTSNGAWTDPANWDIHRVPNNSSTEAFDVVWDDHPVTITLDQTVTIHDFTNSTPGTLQLNGGTLGTSSDGVVALTAGQLLGQGEIGRARLGGAGGPVLSGQISFKELVLQSGAKVRVTLGGRTPGTFDHFTVSDQMTFGGTLEVGFGGGFETNVLSVDAFEIFSFQESSSVGGEFGNVSFAGEFSHDPPRLTTSDGRGTFLVNLTLPHSLLPAGVALYDFLLPSVTAHWTNDLAGDWHDPNNWDIHHVPNNDGINFYDVIWDDHPVTITVDRPVTIQNLTFRTPGVLGGLARLQIAGHFTWENGTMSGSGATAVLGGADLIPASTNSLRLDDHRTLSLSGISSVRGTLWLQNDAQIVNERSGYLNFDDTATFQSSAPLGSPPSYQVKNLGNFDDLAASFADIPQVTIDADFLNRGTITAWSRFVCNRDFRQEAGWTFAQSGEIVCPGSLNLLGGELNARGFVRSGFVAGKLVSVGGLTFNNLVFSSGATLNIFSFWPVPAEPYIIIQNGADLGGCTLELSTSQDLYLNHGTIYDLIYAASGTPVIGTFGNVPFGGRLRTIENRSAFTVDHDGPSVVLKDFSTDAGITNAGSICLAVFLQFLQDVSTTNAVSKKDLTPGISLASLYALEALMKQSRAGQELVNLYWEYTPEVVAILRTNPPLASAAIKVFTDFQPALLALLSGKGQSVQITAPLLAEVNSAWNMLTNYASPRLRSALESQRVRFNGFQDFVDKDFAQWAGLLQIPAPAQPWIFLSNPKLLGPPQQTNRVFTVQANEILGRTQSLWRSTNLSSWTPTPSLRSSTANSTVEFSDTNAPPGSLFYRGGVQP